MSEKTENTKEKDSLEDELTKIKQEMSDIKDLLKSQRTEGYDEDNEELFINGDPDRPRKPRRPRAPRRPSHPRRTRRFSVQLDPEDYQDYDVDLDRLDAVSDTLGDYLQTVFQGVSENLRNSVGQMSRGFRAIDLNVTKEAQKVAQHELTRVKRSLKQQERHLKREMHRAGKDLKGYGTSIIYKKLEGEELINFYETAPGIVSAISDARRLKLLKELEKQPLYQGDLSDKTDIKGGTFKHHMDGLIEAKYVHQEKTRGRYLITQLGMEALKLAEMLYRRYTFETKKEKGEEFEVDLDEEAIDVDLEFDNDLEDIDIEMDEQNTEGAAEVNDEETQDLGKEEN